NQHWQAIASQMRTLFVANFWLAAAFDELLEHPIDIRAAHAASELAIAERASATLAKQVVIFTVQRPATIKCPDRRHSLLNSPAAFKNEWSITAKGQVVSGQKPTRPGTNYNRTFV